MQPAHKFLLLSFIGIAVYALVHRPAAGPDPGRLLKSAVYVLDTYDVDNKGSLPDAQRELLDSPTYRAWLDGVCVKEAAAPAWRIVKSAEQFNDDQPEFKRLMAEPRTSANWQYISDGKKTLSSGPLPASEADAEALIGKYAK